MFCDNPSDNNIEKHIREDAYKNPPIVEVLGPGNIYGLKTKADNYVQIAKASYSNDFMAKERQETITALQDLIEDEEFEDATEIGIDYLKKDYNDEVHELVINIIWENGLSIMDLDTLIDTFPDDFRNYVVKGDANLVSFYLFGDGIVADNEADDDFSTEEKVSPRIAQCMHDYKKAILLAPKDDYIYGMLAWAIWEKGDIAATEKMYKKAIGIAPHNPFGYYMIGYFYDYEGESDKAILSYKEALGLDKQSEVVIKSFSNIINKYYHKVQLKFSKHIPQSVDEIRYICLQKLIKIYKKIDNASSDENVELYLNKLKTEFPGSKKKEKYRKYKKRTNNSD